MRHTLFIAALALSAVEALAAPSGKRPGSSTADSDLFLSMRDVEIGVQEGQERAQFKNTIKLEKDKLTRKMLRTIYENAHDMYRSGNYDGARQLTGTILQIDPNFEDAAFLQKASRELAGSETPLLSERKLAEERFQEGLDLYRAGRVVEASNRWRETTVLAPGNLKAKYWLRRANQDIAEEHFRRGQELYGQRRLREALEQFYNCFSRYQNYPKIQAVIAQVESEHQAEEAGARLQEALTLYGRGDLEGTERLLKQVLELAPGNSQASRLYQQVRGEVAGRTVVEARSLTKQRKYPEAIEAWKRAAASGHDSSAAQTEIARLRDIMKRDEQRRKDEAREAKRREREEAAEKKKEEAEGEEEGNGRKKKKGMGMIPTIQTMGPASPQPAAAAGPVGESPATEAGPAPAPAQGAGAAPAPAPAVITEENKRNSMSEYERGLIAFLAKDMEKASEHVTRALQLDPNNLDASTLKERIEQARNQR